MSDGRSLESQVVNGQYPLLRYLGGSDNSAVFLTEREQEPRKAAIKLVPVSGGAAAGHLSRWEATAKLSHPHLIFLFEFGRCEIRDQAYVYVVMEHADEDLSQIIPTRALTSDEARGMLFPVIDALRYLHGQALVHGHLRPANIMAVGDYLKISSDGVVRGNQAEEAPHLSSPYDPPEAASAGPSAAGDVWSLAATLAEVLTQLPPDRQRIGEGELVVPQTLPKPFSDICRHSLQHSPDRRWSLDEIAASLASPPISAPPVAPPVMPHPQRAPSRKPGWILAAIVVVFIALAVVAIVRRRHPAPESTSSSPQAAVPDRAANPAPNPMPSSTGGARESAQPSNSIPMPAPTPKNTPANSLGTVLQQVLPDVSRGARSTIRGTVRVEVRVVVDSSGKVADARFVSPGPSKFFANLALQSSRKWKFAPAEPATPLASRDRIIRFEFRRSGTGARVLPVAQRSEN